MLTAASIDDMREATDTGVDVHATVGIDHPTWAAVDDGLAGDGAFAGDPAPGTINVVAFVPARLSDAAMVNAVVTLTEAKTQALLDAGHLGHRDCERCRLHSRARRRREGELLRASLALGCPARPRNLPRRLRRLRRGHRGRIGSRR